MSMSMDFGSLPHARIGTPTGCFLYDPESGTFEPLPYVKCRSITRHEGGKFSTADFEYVSQNALFEEEIIYFENVLPLDGQIGPSTVRVDERVVVAGLTPDGDYRFLFDGFCTSPGTQWSGEAYEVNFHAVGVEKRCWDVPLQVRWERRCHEATDGTSNVPTQRPIRFNPKGRANCTPEGFDMLPLVSDEELDAAGLDPDDESEENMNKIAAYVNEQAFPIFVDELFRGKAEDGSDAPRPWTLSSVAKYILAVGNQELYVRNPDMQELDALLDVYTPKKGMRYVDRADPSTYDEAPIVVKDVDVTTMAWPEALALVLDANGFSMCFRLDRDEDGLPRTTLDVYKKHDDDPTKYKDLYLDAWGERFDPALNNIGDADMQHDMSGIYNKVVLRTEVIRKEVSIVLAPLFDIEADDVQEGKKKHFDEINGVEVTGEDGKKYRNFGLDECGEGHWDMRQWLSENDVADLKVIFPDSPSFDEAGDPIPTYVTRPRPAKHELNSRDKDGTPLKPILMISVDYTGPTPAVWDGENGTWFEVPHGKGWRLLRNRFGVRLTCARPNAWHIGEDKTRGFEQLRSGEVRMVEWLHDAKTYNGDVRGRAGYGNVYLMLTAVVEADVTPMVVSERREVSPTRFAVGAAIDVRTEHIPKYISDKSWTIDHLDSSLYDVGKPIDKDDPKTDNVIDWDRKEAQAYCDAKREAHHLGKFQSRLKIPRLTNAYEIGDRIREIDGREFSFAMNLTGGREADAYPKVVGVVWNLDDRQETQLVLSDTEILRRSRRTLHK